MAQVKRWADINTMEEAKETFSSLYGVSDNHVIIDGVEIALPGFDDLFTLDCTNDTAYALMNHLIWLAEQESIEII